MSSRMPSLKTFVRFALGKSMFRRLEGKTSVFVLSGILSPKVVSSGRPLSSMHRCCSVAIVRIFGRALVAHHRDGGGHARILMPPTLPYSATYSNIERRTRKRS